MTEAQGPASLPPATPWWKSKTLWTCVAVASLSFSPLLEEVIKGHPTLVLCAVSGAFAVLRVLTIGGVKK
jgi:hypothetical protein